MAPLIPPPMLWPIGPFLPTGSKYVYIVSLVSLMPVCVVYVVKDVTSFSGARSINGRGE